MPRSYGSGILTGVAVSVAAMLLAPALSRWGRPLAKEAIKGGLDAYEAGRGRLAEFGEHLEDLVAEAQMERATERLASLDRDGAAAGAGPAGPREVA